MTDDELKQIEALIREAEDTYLTRLERYDCAIRLIPSVPRLLAEIRRLRAELAKLEDLRYGG
jgi:hypothetical protein